jgi:hypothetical protein
MAASRCRQGRVVAERGPGYDGVQIGSCTRQGIGGAGPGQRSPSGSWTNSCCQLLPAITFGEYRHGCRSSTLRLGGGSQASDYPDRVLFRAFGCQ